MGEKIADPMKKAFEQTPYIDDLGILHHFEKHIDDCAGKWTEAQHDVYYAPYTVDLGLERQDFFISLPKTALFYTCVFVNLLARDFHQQQTIFAITFSCERGMQLFMQ